MDITMSDEACKLQLQRLEITQGIHDERISLNHDDIREQALLLDKMIKMLSQIRWIITGGMAFFVVENIGLIQAIRKIIGL